MFESHRPDGITLIIPAYNEENRIMKSLDSYVPALKSANIPFEVLVIFDGNDGTEEVVDRYGVEQIKTFRFNRKLGKGGAIREGINLAKYSVLCWVDADGSLDAADLLKMIELVPDFGCVVASRWMDRSVWLAKEPLFNRAVGRVFNFLVRGLLGLPILDTQCGAKVFRASLAKKVISSTVVTNRTFDVAMLFHARKLGANMIEYPVSWKHDDDTRMPIFRVIPIMFITLIGIRLMNLPIKKYMPRRFVSYFVARYARD
jgi:dolichyl-phosphate beta-glucosyltransferase